MACEHKSEKILGKKDSPKIVIDEVAGYLIAMAWLSPSPACLAIGFLFSGFRMINCVQKQRVNDKRDLFSLIYLSVF
jgi:phosphatidylglycerophosphatase A